MGMEKYGASLQPLSFFFKWTEMQKKKTKNVQVYLCPAERHVLGWSFTAPGGC